MKKSISLAAICLVVGFSACKKDSEFLDIPPLSVIPSETAFKDPALVISVLGDLYNRYLDFSSLDNGWRSFADFSESFPSENGSNFIVQRNGWGYGEWRVWDYGYVRELNLFIERLEASTALNDAVKARFMAEGRFLRASYYFEMTKRMGGVPLILAPLQYDYKGDPTYLQTARSKEHEMYDFVISEADAILNDLPADLSDRSRANRGAALAMKSRAALYAASIAKYNSTTPSVTLPGGEVGIPASMATAYYEKALDASQRIINGEAGNYKLYASLPNLSDNFAAVFTDKSVTNQEAIFIEDFRAFGGKTHAYTTNNQPYSVSDEGGDAGRLNPSLNLVQAFELLDGTFAPLPTTDGSGNPIFYTNQEDIFAGRDARLAGTVLIPNSIFKGERLDISAGTIDASGNVGGSPGIDGPVNGLEFRTQTGFYVRKWIDQTPGSGRRGRGSDVPFIRYRYAEVLLNAAEAAFELGQPELAATYMNQVRSRAGLTTPLTAGDINFDRIVHERRVELAFEGHTLYDMKRWRLAHIVWDGNTMDLSDLKANLGSATKRNTQPWGLWPYKYVNPGNPNDGKWIFREVKPALVTGSNRFLLGNYYTEIDNGAIAANPKLVRQPNQ